MENILTISNGGQLEPIIFNNEKLFDIRDIYGASIESKRKILKNIEVEKKHTNLLISNMKKEQEKIIYNKLKLEKLEKEIEFQKKKIYLQEMLLSAVGISRKDVDEAFERIKIRREYIKYKLYNEDKIINERVISKFETEVSDIVNKITQKSISTQTKEYYESILKAYLKEDVWSKKLCEISRNNLITARMNYDAMMQMKDKEILDFSGVCLLLTKTLDIELSRRFYTNYVSWLMEKYPLSENIHKWPKVLLNKEKLYKFFMLLDYKKINIK